MVNVSWNDAVAFTEWLSDETGQAFRLPTEAEWEKACRGTTGLVYPWGDSVRCEQAQLRQPTLVIRRRLVSYSPDGDSPYGVADMAGNVWEWTSSQYEDYPYNANDGRENLTGYLPTGCCVAGRSSMGRPMCAAQFVTATTLRTATLTSGFGLGLRPLLPLASESAPV